MRAEKGFGNRKRILRAFGPGCSIQKSFPGPKPNGAAGVSWNEAVCDRQSVNQVCHHHNPPAALFTPLFESMNEMKTIPNFPRTGFTLLEIMIVVAIIGLLAAIAIPNFVRARTTSQKNACINNLRQLDGAVQQFALENKKAATSTVALTDCTPYLKNSTVCPAGGTTITDSYAVSDCQTAPTCVSSGGGSVNGHVLPQ